MADTRERYSAAMVESAYLCETLRGEPEFPEWKRRFTYLIRSGISVCLAAEPDAVRVTGKYAGLSDNTDVVQHHLSPKE